MKKGFSLVELMVVLGILGILSGIMLVATSGSSDSARAAKCLGNMHTLATACHAVGMESGYYPPAGSWERRVRQVGKKVLYGEVPGWISWASQGAYPPNNQPTTSKGNASWFISTYFQPKNRAQREWRHHALTNAAIWRAVSGNADTFVCPLHVKLTKKHQLEPLWSYVMNSYFRWAGKATPEPRTASAGLDFGELEKAERRLLFAELPFNESYAGQTCTYNMNAGTKLDPTLQYEDGFNEVIGANHKRGRKWYAHVCFADGHAEALEIPTSLSTTQFRNLTKWLCQGTDVSFNGKQYEELKK